MKTIMARPKVTFDGTEGFVFAILLKLQGAATDAGWSSKRWKEVESTILKEADGDHNEKLLAAMRKYFDVTLPTED